MSFRNISIFNRSNSDNDSVGMYGAKVWPLKSEKVEGRRLGDLRPSIHFPWFYCPAIKVLLHKRRRPPLCSSNFDCWTEVPIGTVFLCRSLYLFQFSPLFTWSWVGRKQVHKKSESSAITMTSLLHLIDWFLISTVQTDAFSRHLE